MLSSLQWLLLVASLEMQYLTISIDCHRDKKIFICTSKQSHKTSAHLLGYKELQALGLLLQRKTSPKQKSDRGGLKAFHLRWPHKLERVTVLDTYMTIYNKWDTSFFLHPCPAVQGKYLILNLRQHQKSNLSLILHRLITLGKSVSELFLVLTSIKGSTLLKCS